MKGATAIGFTAVSPSRVDPSWQVQGVAETTTGDMAVWYMSGTSAFGSCSSPPAGSQLHSGPRSRRTRSV